MKPTFALDLTRDAIALLHRTPKGWLAIGEVAFDAPDLAEALDYLRKTALGLSPMGFATKIVLPNSQILYTEVDAPGPSRNDKRRQIAAALEGRTPYAVEDLVYDWSGKGATVKVAVIARETLAEAEDFAVTHRLNPVSFVAIPEDGAFVGEPWFGPTAASETILASGEGVDRDREAIRMLHRDQPVSEDGAHAVAAGQDVASDEAMAMDTLAEAMPEPPVAAATGTAEDEPLPGLEEALSLDPSAPASADGEPTAPPPAPPTAPPTAPPDEAVAEVDAETEHAGAEHADPDDAPPEAMLQELARDYALSDAAQHAATDPLAGPAREPAPTSAPSSTPGSTPSSAVDTEVEEAPFAHVTDPAAFPDTDDVPPMPAALRQALDGTTASAATPADDIPSAPSSAAMMAFASRRASATGVATGAGAVPVGGATRPVVGAIPPQAPGARLAQPIPRPAGAKAFPGLVTAPSIPGTRAKPKGKPATPGVTAAAATRPVTVKSPVRPGGTFGTAAPPKNRSGVILMVLVALLLIFLALVAALSSFFLTRSESPQADQAVAAVDIAPDMDDEMLADLQDPAELAALLPGADPGLRSPADVGAMATEPAPEPLVVAEPVAEPAAVPVAEPAAVPVAEPVAVPAAEDEQPAARPEALADLAAPADTPADALANGLANGPGPASEPAPGTAITTEVTAAQAPAEDQDEIFLSAMDAPPPALDAFTLPAPVTTSDVAPDRPMPPPAFGTVYQFGPDGLLKPTPSGILSPEGVMLIAGKPPRLPPPRSEAAAAAALAAAPVDVAPAPEAAAPDAISEELSAPVSSPSGASLVTAADPQVPTVAPVASDPAMAGFRPRPRPEGLAPEVDDDAALATEPASDFAGLRPLPRPGIVLAAAATARPAPEPADLGAQAASLTAQAESQLAAAAALEAQNPSVVAISKRPQGRPRDLSRAVEAAVAAAVREPEPKPEVVAAAAAAPAPAPAPALKPDELDDLDEPDIVVAAPKIPTKASVAKQATFNKAINLKRINLIGTYGTDSRRTALIRQSNGRYAKIKVGDKIDGGTVKAITETEVRYQKGGKLLALTMPKS